MRPRGAVAIALTTACVLALEPFHALTVAGAVAQLTAVHLLGRAGSPLLSGLLVLPYVGLALAAAGDSSGSADSTVRVVAVLVATLASAAAATGITRHVRTAAQAHSATEQAFADTLLEHAARGERARIARELHDVVAHHISMIAVQAETARLTDHAGHGHSLLGMRERAATVGGTLRTDPAPGGGFLVEARLPVRAEALT